MEKKFNYAVVLNTYEYATPFYSREEAEKHLLGIKEREDVYCDSTRLTYISGALRQLDVFYGIHHWTYGIKTYEELENYKSYFPNLFK